MTARTSGKLQPSSYIYIYTDICVRINLEIPSSFGIENVWLSLGAFDLQCIHQENIFVFFAKKKQE